MAANVPGQRRAEIVEATWGLLVDGGVEAATMRRVASAADATTGRVTHHFGSRTELLFAALVEVERRQVRITQHFDLDPIALLRAVLLEHLPLDAKRVREQRVWLALASTGVPELRDEANRQRSEWEQMIETLARSARDGTAVDGVLGMVVAIVDGLSLRLTFDMTPGARRDAERVLDDVLARAGILG